jgi:hypothetical protein
MTALREAALSWLSPVGRERRLPEQSTATVRKWQRSCQKVEAVGGVIVMPKTEIGSQMGWIAAFRDTEGNILGFHEAPPAKQAKETKKKPRAKRNPAR